MNKQRLGISGYIYEIADESLNSSIFRQAGGFWNSVMKVS